MDWVKRNLYFVIGSAAALILMVLAGLYLYHGWSAKNQAFEKLSAQYAELQRLYGLNPHPGSDKINNVKAARDQQDQLRAFMRQSARWFAPIAPIPDPGGTNRVTSEGFTSALRRTVDQLQRDAANASVTLPPNYTFSFEAQKTLMTFAPGSLDLLAAQLGEIKVLSEALFAAKVNAVDNLRRERVSPDDHRGPPSDYLEQKSATNALAVLTPYEITFRCFSSELAAVLNSLHASPHCLLVKTVDVEPASAGMGMYDPNAPGAMPGMPLPGYGMPSAEAPPSPYMQRYGTGVEGIPQPMRRYPVGGSPEGTAVSPYAQRYGGMGPEGGGGGPVAGGIPYRPLGTPQPGAPMTPTYAPPAMPMPVGPGMSPGAAVTRGGLQTVLNEKPLRVTLLIHVVKLLPQEPKR